GQQCTGGQRKVFINITKLPSDLMGGIDQIRVTLEVQFAQQVNVGILIRLVEMTSDQFIDRANTFVVVQRRPTDIRQVLDPDHILPAPELVRLVKSVTQQDVSTLEGVFQRVGLLSL